MRSLVVFSILVLLLTGALVWPGEAPPDPALAAGFPGTPTSGDFFCNPDDWRPAYRYVLAASIPGEGAASGEELARARTVLGDRLATDEFSVLADFFLEPAVVPGSNQIEAPLRNIGRGQEVLIERLLEREGVFEFIGANTELPGLGTPITTTRDQEEAAAAGTPEATGPVFLTVVSSEDVDPESILVNDLFGNPIVEFQFTEQGAQELREYTASHVGQRVAFLLDDGPIFTTTIDREWWGFRLSRLPRSDALALAIVLQSGPLPMPLTIVGTPDLRDSIICPQ